MREELTTGGFSALDPRGAQRGPPCSLRTYVYPHLQPYLEHQLRTAHLFLPLPDAHLAAPGAPKNVSCLQRPCAYNSSFKDWNIRQYTAEAAIYERIVAQCPLVADPSQADMYLVPFLFGFMMSIGWVHPQLKGSSPQRLEHGVMVAVTERMRAQLTHLNRTTASRHVILFTVDSEFIYMKLHPSLTDTVLIHLGDDAFGTHHNDAEYKGIHSSRRFVHGLTVPYRVSQWLPHGFVAPSAHSRPLLLSMNVDWTRSRSRATIASDIRAGHSALEPSLRVRHPIEIERRMLSPPGAAKLASRSTFCVCPTGDSKGFTARLYFALLHGCVPIRIDGWRRNRTTSGPPEWPFRSSLNWSLLALDVPLRETPTLVERLVTMPPGELERRQAYLRRVAHRLLFDSPEHAHHDAPATLLHELHVRLLGRGAHEG